MRHCRHRATIVALIAASALAGGLLGTPPAAAVPAARASAGAPAPVSAVRAYLRAPTVVSLHYRRPGSADFTGVLIRRRSGAGAPGTPHAGTYVADVARSNAGYVDRSLPRPGTWSYALFAHDGHGHYARAATLRVTTSERTALPPAVEGTVHDPRGNPVAGAQVSATDDAGDVVAQVTAADDGFYALRTLVAGRSYGICAAPTAPGSAHAAGCAGHRVTPSASSVTRGVSVTLPDSTGLSGTVATSAGTALRGVRVLAYAPSAAAGDDPLGSATSAADGTWTISGLAPASTGYVVCADPSAATPASGPAPATGYGGQCAGGQPWSPALDVPSGAETLAGGSAAAPFVLPAGGRVAGQVTGSGAPGGVAGARVSLLATADDGAAGDAGDVLATATTTGAGRFGFAGLPAGAVDVCVDPVGAGGYARRCYTDGTWSGSGPPDGAQVVAVSAGTTSTADVGLVGGATVTGTVRRPSGAGLGGVSVGVYDTEGRRVAAATTAGDGTYTITGVAASSSGYRVCLDASGATGPQPDGYLDECYGGAGWQAGTTPPGTARVVQLRAGEVRRVDVRLVLAGGISGTVTGVQHAALGGVQVFAIVPGISVASTSTTSNGAYRLPRLTTGDYVLCFAADDARPAVRFGYLDVCWRHTFWRGETWDPPVGASVVDVPAGTDVPGADVDLPQSPALSGTVTASATGARLRGVPVAVFGDDGVEQADGTTSADGSYLLTGVPRGTVRVCFGPSNAEDPAALDYVDQCYRHHPWGGVDAPTRYTPITTQGGALKSGVDAALRTGAAIAGRVRSPGGDGLSGVAVTAYSDGAAQARTTSGSDGSYALTGLAAGSYTVCYAPSVDTTGGTSSTGYQARCYRNVAWDGSDDDVPANATPVAVHAAATTALELVAPVGGSVSGTVMAAGSGGAIAGVEVDVFDDDANLLGSTDTVSGGGYLLDGLPTTGHYTVCFATATVVTDGPGYLSQCAGGVAWDGGMTPAPGAHRVAARAGAQVDAALAPAGAVGGTVTDSSGAAVGSVAVRVFDATGAQLGVGWTGADGSYEVSSLPADAGGYTVCFGTADAVGPAPDGYLAQCYRAVAWDGSRTDLPTGTTPVPVSGGEVAGGVDARLTAAP